MNHSHNNDNKSLQLIVIYHNIMINIRSKRVNASGEQEPNETVQSLPTALSTVVLLGQIVTRTHGAQSQLPASRHKLGALTACMIYMSLKRVASTIA